MSTDLPAQLVKTEALECLHPPRQLPAAFQLSTDAHHEYFWRVLETLGCVAQRIFTTPLQLAE